MFFRKTEIEKADLLGERLVGGATEIASIIMEELSKRYNVGFRDGDSFPQFVIEVIVFYMHLIDRLAFAYLGSERREVFCDRFIVAVVNEMLRDPNPRTSTEEGLRRSVRDTYNCRQMEYAKYELLVPKKDAPLRGTLYWEFSKILFGFLDDQNPATLIFIDLLVADMTEVMLKDAMKVEEVLRS